MNGGAVVITSVEPAFHRPIFRFARDLCKTDDLDVIVQAGGISSLFKANGLTADDSMRRQLQRDVFETRAHAFWQRGFRTCVIVLIVPCNREHEHFDECIKRVTYERDVILTLTLFRKFHLACMTPNSHIVYVGNE